MAQVAAVSLPAMLLAGAFAQAQIPQKAGGGVAINAQSLSAYSLYGLGGLGMMVSSSVFHRRTIKSRSYLTQQGLSVPRTPSVIVPTLAVVGVAAAFGSSSIRAPGDDVRTGGLIAGLGLYAVSVGIGTFQLDLNRRARRDAGWLGLVPAGDARAPGLALAGQW